MKSTSNLIDIHVLDNRDSLEVSELRSALVFGHKKIRDSRDSIMMKAVFSIILYLKEDERTITGVLDSYCEKLCHAGDKMDVGQLKTILNKLTEEKLIEINEERITVKTSANAEKFVNNVNERTVTFINKIIEKTQNEYGRSIEPKFKEKLTVNIKMALSVYFKLAGFEFFKKARKSHENETEDAVAVAMKNISDNKLSNALITALADTIHSDDKETREILEIWGKAYMSTQVMNLDPSLRQFKLRQLRGKAFVLDTDFVLNCLAKKTRFSEVYSRVLNTLVSSNCQCDVIIPYEVVTEVNNHAKSAIFLYSQFGDGVMQLPDEFLETQLANVFIEDYVKIKRSDPDCRELTFNNYLKNIVYPGRPSFLEKKVASISPKIKMGFDKSFGNIGEDSRLEDLKKTIYQDICKSEKGCKRDDSVNHEIAQTDAILYLTVYKKDEGLDDLYALSKKAYLLSRSTRSMKCAKRLKFENNDVICTPKTLIAVFSEIGMVNNENSSIINLFENPFLTYTAHRIWNDVEGLMSVGADIKYSDIDRLRYEYEDDVNDVLTARTSEEFETEIRKWISKNYNWANNTGNLLERIKALQQQVAERDEIIEAKTEENEKLRSRKHNLNPLRLIQRHKHDSHNKKQHTKRRKK